MAEPVVRSVAAFLVLVLGCAALLAGTAALTSERIDENRARQFLDTVTSLTGRPAAGEVSWTGDVAHLCDGTALLRGRAPGYGGAIVWLAAVDLTGPAPRLEGLRVTRHQETPGIADFLNAPETGWLASLSGAGADGLRETDAVSGATITSRALVTDLAARLQDPALAEPECPA